MENRSRVTFESFTVEDDVNQAWVKVNAPKLDINDLSFGVVDLANEHGVRLTMLTFPEVMTLEPGTVDQIENIVRRAINIVVKKPETKEISFV